jgi:hypothetical protein
MRKGVGNANQRQRVLEPTTTEANFASIMATFDKSRKIE